MQLQLCWVSRLLRRHADPAYRTNLPRRERSETPPHARRISDSTWMSVVIEEKDFTWSHYLFDPAPNVNYNVILCLQLAGAFISAVCGVLWFTLGIAEGFWLIFFPFVPSAAWAYVVRGRWIRDDWDPSSRKFQAKKKVAEKKKREQDAKKKE